MKTVNLIAVLILLVLVVQSAVALNAHSFNATCNHETFDGPSIRVCKIQSQRHSVQYENTTISIKSNTETTEGFIVEDMEMFYIPKGIENFIKKLSLLIIKNCGLRKVTNENLRPFNELNYLDLSYNQIEILESDVFNASKYLGTIILKSNKIKVVEENAFKSLQNIYNFDFTNNNCYSGKSDQREGIIFVVEQIEKVCKNFNLKLWNHISNNNEKFDNLTKENAEIRNMLAKFMAMKTENFREIVKDETSTLKYFNMLLTSLTLILIIIFVLAIIKYKNLILLNSEESKKRIHPYERINNITKSNVSDLICNDQTIDDGTENFYQELPYEEIRRPNVNDDTHKLCVVNEAYSNMETPADSQICDNAAAIYAVVNKN